ncbi:hypothetical protein A7K73_07635 [Candidatus Methylacidiphilum fumarolicum]|nr:hypothetical protein A7K73_07635 [Candidatus Methylacidiphilum fumarolicum]TFE76492.1 hypothetical protein A7D33_09855 [Candidatus Methylacidiphilum fumarolicum]
MADSPKALRTASDPQIISSGAVEALLCPLSESISKVREHQNDALSPLLSGKGLQRVLSD